MFGRLELLSQDELRRIHDGTISVLSSVGIQVTNDAILDRLVEAGARVDRLNRVAYVSEALVMESVAQAGKSYTLYGRDRTRTARFGAGDIVTISSPGQHSWVDPVGKTRRPSTSEDTHKAIALADALPHIDIVGAMTQPVDIPTPIRDVYLTAELVKYTTKPTRCWIADGRTARYILEIYRTIAGGEAALRQYPLIEAFIEPISPLKMPPSGMEILIEFTRAGLPVSVGPMVMASASGPVTLAGTLVLENAENLAVVVLAQVLRPGTPVMYGGIPHIMDPRNAVISFGSPEQAIMAVAMVQIARWYGLPAYVNTGLTDSKLVDAQAGLEKGITFVLGALAGADLCSHVGISGADQGASLPQLVVDNEMVGYIKRVLRGLKVDARSLAADVIEEVGIGGSYLSHEHTALHFREEFWLPGPLWDRNSWDIWSGAGGSSMLERAVDSVDRILATHQPEPIDPAMARELDNIVKAAGRELL